jgi:hypothetical protein
LAFIEDELFMLELFAELLLAVLLEELAAEFSVVLGAFNVSLSCAAIVAWLFAA